MIDSASCVGCGVCYAVCPVSCITMEENEAGFFYPHIDMMKCCNCGKCVEKCPVAKQPDVDTRKDFERQYMAGYALGENMNELSTSGGIATFISKQFVKNGLVFGASFTNGVARVEHVKCVSEEECDRLAGSKYVQSKTHEVYKDIQEELANNRRVLYIGTPCQVAGVKKIVRHEDEDRLYTIDFICHGVPAPLAWEKYALYLEKKKKSKICRYNFRYKAEGWGKLTVKAEFANGKDFTSRADFNAYHCWFGNHYSLRKSCFGCQFRSKERESDLTIADFWHVQKYIPDISTCQGVSAIQANTTKGLELLQEGIKGEKLWVSLVSEDSIWSGRKITSTNFHVPEQWDEFQHSVATLTPKELVKKYPPLSYWDLLIDKGKCMLKRK